MWFLQNFHVLLYLFKEWGYNDARDLYRNVGDDPAATIESKRRAFDKICENYSPGKNSNIPLFLFSIYCL
jgi:hypothetical protein